LPTLAHDVTGDPGVHLAALEQAITDAGVVVTRLADLGGAHGYSQPGRITILESLTPADTTAVLVHEFARLCAEDGYVTARRPCPPCTPVMAVQTAHNPAEASVPEAVGSCDKFPRVNRRQAWHGTERLHDKPSLGRIGKH
jgi:hypothetical protein